MLRQLPGAWHVQEDKQSASSVLESAWLESNCFEHLDMADMLHAGLQVSCALEPALSESYCMPVQKPAVHTLCPDAWSTGACASHQPERHTRCRRMSPPSPNRFPDRHVLMIQEADVTVCAGQT